MRVSVSAEIKQHLKTEADRLKPCCAEAFVRGERLDPIEEGSEKLCELCGRSYIGGAFCAYGTLTDPKKAFHLEFTLPKGEYGLLMDLLSAEGFEPKLIEGRKKDRLYYKGSETIEDFLTYIGAARFSLEIMELKVINEVRITENRRANAVYANLDRAATAAADQVSAIKLLRKTGKFELLSEPLKATAVLREENPDASLEELRMLFEVPISKSGLNHRLAKLISEADKIDE